MSANKLLHKRDVNAEDGPVEMRLGYSKKNPAIPKKTGWLFHRKDYHEDGSISDTYGVELTREQFLAFGGVELPKDPVLNTSQEALAKEIYEKAKQNPHISLEEYKKIEKDYLEAMQTKARVTDFQRPDIT